MDRIDTEFSFPPTEENICLAFRTFVLSQLDQNDEKKFNRGNRVTLMLKL